MFARNKGITTVLRYYKLFFICLLFCSFPTGSVAQPWNGAQSVDNPILVDIAGSSPTVGQLYFYNGTNLVPATGLIYDAVNEQLQIGSRIVDRTNSIVTESTTVSNTIAETTIYTGGIAAGTLQAGNYLKFSVSGGASNANPTDDFTVRVYLGATLLEAFVPEIGLVTGADWHVEGRMTIRSVGASGSVASNIHVEIDDHSESVSAVNAVDTTAEQDITITIQWDTADAGNIVTLYQGALEYKH